MKKTNGISRGLPWLMSIVLSGLVAACGGGGQSPILGAGSIAPVATVPPTVTFVSPLPFATGVAQNTNLITAAFSKAMDPATITSASFTLSCPLTPAVSGGEVTYLAATRVATLRVPAGMPVATCTAMVTSAVKDSTGVAMISNYPWQFTTAGADTDAPTVAPVNPLNLAINVATNSSVKALFNESMNPLTVDTSTFTLSGPSGPVAGTVTLGPLNRNATFKPNSNLAVGTTYTANITSGSKDLAGNPVTPLNWSFTTAATVAQSPSIDLITAKTFGTFGGTAGMTNTGIQTKINGDIGTTATGTSMVTGFHEDPYSLTGDI
jgi:hypothetical protein